MGTFPLPICVLVSCLFSAQLAELIVGPVKSCLSVCQPGPGHSHPQTNSSLKNSPESHCRHFPGHITNSVPRTIPPGTFSQENPPNPTSDIFPWTFRFGQPIPGNFLQDNPQYLFQWLKSKFRCGSTVHWGLGLSEVVYHFLATI